jgi:hypothetical protein
MVHSKFFETVHPKLILILGKKVEIGNVTSRGRQASALFLVATFHIPGVA